MALGTPGDGAGVLSQTLDRGLRVLQLLAAADRPQTVAEVAATLQVHRSIAYRILRTLEAHRLAERDPHQRYGLGVGIAALARSVRRDLQTAALPEMADVADELGMTAFLVVPDRAEAVTVASVEPRHSQVHVTYRPGVRHPIDHGAPGIALLAGRPPVPGQRPEVALARERGWATSFQEVLPGMRAVSSPITLPGAADAAIAAVAVVYVSAGADTERIGARLVAAARSIEGELR